MAYICPVTATERGVKTTTMKEPIKIGTEVFEPDFGTGKVIDIRVGPWPFAVRFDNLIGGLHDCNGLTDEGHGAFYSESEIVSMRVKQ